MGNHKLIIQKHENAGDFLESAESMLMRNEAENGLMLGVASRVLNGLKTGTGGPYFLSVKDEGEIIGAVIRTPPYPLLISLKSFNPDCIEQIADYLLYFDPGLSGVNGTVEIASAFADFWKERRFMSSEVLMNMRLFELKKVNFPENVSGFMRKAKMEDLDTLSEWTGHFHRESMTHEPEPESGWASVTQIIIQNEFLMVWDDNGPVSMAGCSRKTGNGASINLVYTPEEKRGNYYASACVAALSQRLLDSGNAFCTLFTNLDNPVSNRIYPRIGYKPISDWQYYRFITPADP